MLLPHPAVQIELDFKAECKAGNTIEAHCNPLQVGGAPAGGDGAHGNGNGANGAGHHEPQLLLHMLQKCDDTGCTELVRARTTWRQLPMPPPA